MNKVALIVGGVIVVAAAVVSPFLLGVSVESDFKKNTKELKSSVSTVAEDVNVDSSFNRGWLFSTAKTIIDINHSTITMNQEITNGPWAYFGRAKMEYSFEFEGKLKTYIEELFAGKSPLAVTETISFSGNNTLKISSPSFSKQTLSNLPGIEFTWGGLEGLFTLSDNRIESNLKVPEFTIYGPSTGREFNLTNLSLVSDEFYTSNVSKNISKSWAGKTQFTIEKIAIKDAMSGSVASTSLSMTSSTKDEPSNKIGSSFSLKLNDIQLPQMVSNRFLNGNMINQFEFNLSLTEIPKAPLATLIDQANQSKVDISSLYKIMPQFQEFALSYAQGTPSIIANVNIEGNRGHVSVATEVKLADADSSNNIFSLMMGLKKRLTITVSPDISEGVIDALTSDSRFPMSKVDVVQLMTDNNRFVLTNGSYIAKFEFKNGQFFTNGKPDPFLAQLFNMIPGLPKGIL